MKRLHRLLQGLLIVLILTSAAAIIYVLQWHEEPAKLNLSKEKTGRLDQPSVVLSQEAKDKLLKETLPSSESVAPKEKEKIAISKIGKIPPPQREIAIIIDDIGHDLGPVRELLKIDAAITFAILPFLTHTRDAAEMLHAARREILLHLPMEPASFPREKPGEGALFSDMNEHELLSQLDRNLASVPYISGVNNHMGSRLMNEEDKLKLIFERLKKKNLFFVDSRTTSNSKAQVASEKIGLPLASRSIFLDNRRDYNFIYKTLVGIAQKKIGGDASSFIVIGHPYPETIHALRDALKVLQAKGIAVVPVSKLINNEGRGTTS